MSSVSGLSTSRFSRFALKCRCESNAGVDVCVRVYIYIFVHLCMHRFVLIASCV
jgi:hypothetical protein